jgi:H+/Cl- antiporter ClcA
MKKRLTEESVIFVSVLKWIVLAAAVGGMVGVSTALFLEALGWSIAYTDQSPYSFVLLPAALFVSGALIKYLAPDAEGQGTDKVIEAVHKRSGKMNGRVIPVKIVATVITIAFGGSAGRIGPCAQIGGALSSLFADLLRFDDRDRKKLVICGISAGFASVLGTPIAGAIFGVEVLFVGSILYDVLLPSFVAGVVGYRVASGLGVTYFHSPLNFAPVLSHSFSIEVVMAGIFFGLCSFLLIETLRLGKRISDRISWGLPWQGLIAGFVLVGLTFLFSKKYLGLGLETIQTSIAGNGAPWYAFLLKMVFTSLTLNFAGSGGIVVPILFIGSTAGAFFGEFLQASIATFAAIGFVSLLAGATNAPIAASILFLELFGPEIAPYAAIACVISFLMTGHRSVHPTQVLAIRKSRSLHVEIGSDLEKIKAEFQPRSRSFIGAGLRLIKTIQGKGRS